MYPTQWRRRNEIGARFPFSPARSGPERYAVEYAKTTFAHCSDFSRSLLLVAKTMNANANATAAAAAADDEEVRRQLAGHYALVGEYEALRGVVQDLPLQTRHSVMVPLGPVAFMPGT